MRYWTVALVMSGIVTLTAGINGQQEAKAPASLPLTNYSGCVAKLPKLDKYVLASGKSCMLLSGKFDPAKVGNHQVTLKGLLSPAEDLDPLTLDVRETVSVKDACPKTCVLEPPGTRGLHGHEKPGTEGGPAGVKPTPPKDPPQ